MSPPTYEQLLAENRRYKSILQDLEQAQNRLDLALSAGNLAWWEFDIPTGTVIYNVNKVRLLGYQPHQFPYPCHYTAFTDLIHGDDHQRTMQAMRDHLTGKKQLYEVEYRIRRKDGEYVWFYDRGSITARDRDGKPLYLKGIVFDISERKKQQQISEETEQRLRKANATKDRLFSIISHDLRSSIGGLVQFLRVVEKQPDIFDRSDFKQMITYLRGTSAGTLDLFENLLAWSRSQQNEIIYSPQLIDLGTQVGSALQNLDDWIQKKAITVTTEIPPAMTCTADKNMLDIILRNIITNAIKFSPHRGKIEICAFHHDHYIHIQIRDNGIGMDEKRRKNLFQLEGVGRTSGTDGEAGSGLGLILSKELVERQKGTISVESSPGRGSCFTIIVPE
ncbi:MAG: ATP-binding protein [Chitinivibrionales bacterium]